MRGDREDEVPRDTGTTSVTGAHWCFLAFFASLAAYHVAALGLTALRTGSRGLGYAGVLLPLSFLPSVLLGAGPVIASIRWGRGTRADFGWLPGRRDVLVGLACGGIALLTGYLLNLVLLGLFGNTARGGFGWPVAFDDSDANAFWRTLTAVIMVAVIPLTEELLVHGALWRALEHYKLPPWVILVLTAVVFAYLHEEPMRTVALFGQGLAIGLARLRTRRVGAAFVAHAANNLPPALLLVTGT